MLTLSITLDGVIKLYIILVEMHEGKRTLGRPKHRGYRNILKRVLKE
jgi:hypothetical protein